MSTTDYPWDGKVVLKPQVDQTSKFDLRLRVPGWCQGATVSVNGEQVSRAHDRPRLYRVGREWKDGDVVELNLPMPVQRIAANPNVKADTGQLAIQRGPLVYCLEACDQGEPLASLYLPRDAELKAEKARRPARRGRRRERARGDRPRARLDQQPCIRLSRLHAGADHGDSLLRLGQPQARADEGLASRRPRERRQPAGSKPRPR